MMNKIYSSAIVLALVSLVACNKDGVQTVGETLSANAYISSGSTKTVYDNLPNSYGVKNPVKVSWDVSELFKAYYDGGTAPVIFSKTAAGTSFTAESVPSGVTASTTFTGLYGSAATLNSDGKIDIDFSDQDGTVENLAAYDVMTATSKLEKGMLSFAFHHNCAILRLKCVNYKNEPVKYLKLGFTNALLSDKFGNVGINKNTLLITFAEAVRAGGSKPSEVKSEVRYVMIPAMTYKSISTTIPKQTDYSFSYFEKVIDLDITDSTGKRGKDIKPGYVYDVICNCGVETDEDGWLWGD